ncbi:DUF4268 domain-containing protein [Sphingomonas sp.]|uniref:DUF4268 domain-containing protein n=1 Tax=Sphingomonas sp. TaxID=28214 RepID=UPI0035C7B81A
MNDDLKRYLDQFAAKAPAAGLDVRKPGQNWVPLAPVVRGSHISLSVAANQIQVNLNNDDDVDRRKFDRLAAERAAIQSEIGEGLVWDKKDGRKKTVVRATRDNGYADNDWDEQHRWALAMMKAFTSTFGRRLDA